MKFFAKFHHESLKSSQKVLETFLLCSDFSTVQLLLLALRGQIATDVLNLEKLFSFRVLVVVIFHRQLNSPHTDLCQKIIFHVYQCRKQWLAWVEHVNKSWLHSKNYSLSYFTPPLTFLLHSPHTELALEIWLRLSPKLALSLLYASQYVQPPSK